MRTSAGAASQGRLGDESVTGAAGVGWGGGVRASAERPWDEQLVVAGEAAMGGR